MCSRVVVGTTLLVDELVVVVVVADIVTTIARYATARGILYLPFSIVPLLGTTRRYLAYFCPPPPSFYSLWLRLLYICT